MLAISACVAFVVLSVGVGPRYGDAAIRSAATTLRVGAFNIQTFGRTKMSKEVVAWQIKQIVELYDVILIQEIRDKSVESVRQLLDMLDPTDRVSLLDFFQYEDPEDVFEREPYTVKVAPKNANRGNMSLIGFHARPSDATAEIGHLRDVIVKIQHELGYDSEPIVLGDLNADCSYYANYNKRVAASDYLTTNTATYNWLIGEDADTMVRASSDCAYDRIILRNSFASHVLNGSPSVFDFGQWLGLNENEALDVSDHFPVEMEVRF